MARLIEFLEYKQAKYQIQSKWVQGIANLENSSETRLQT